MKLEWIIGYSGHMAGLYEDRKYMRKYQVKKENAIA